MLESADGTQQKCADSKASDTKWPTFAEIQPHPQDHFATRDGVEFAGLHLIVDFWGAGHLDCLSHIETALREAVEAARATLLHIHLHHFTPNGGISGVAVLAESHISVHTWPERGYAAFDVFMCGDTRPAAAVEVLKSALGAARFEVTEIQRGRVDKQPNR